MRLLVVEDEQKTAEALRVGLVNENYQVALARTGEEGYFRADSEHFDLIVLDVMLPGRSGFEVLDALRKKGSLVPVLMLTARDGVDDRVDGLNLGADDYLVKPFAFTELVARIKALLRRGRDIPVVTLGVSDLQMDLVTRSVRRGDRSLDLTAKEFELLELLLRHQNQIVSRDMLAAVWHDPARVTSLDNVIDVHIARLRKKVDHGTEIKLLQTVRGAGFIVRAVEK